MPASLVGLSVKVLDLLPPAAVAVMAAEVCAVTGLV
jgi:hypothetical protein